ncbi:MAG TPA: hypothetical protein VGP77_06055 [Vicinamibacterales bacterium]|jgi:hypothetical protein|nr:hypothetical protein [Vicinamibacterales bacterium]
MPIVLAIEPDRRQAAHLTAILRQQVGAELVLADTTEGALDAIGNRVPDLVLVPALLSPQDDAALAAALRVIAAAAHVRTLTIPVLANRTRPVAARGMLARWRRSREESPEPDGCDPAVFGEQISTYLREAAAERAQLEQELLEDEPFVEAPPPATRAALMVVDQAPIQLHAFEPIRRWTNDPVVDERPIELDVVEPVQRWTTDPVLDERPIELDVAEPVQPWRADSVDELPIELNAVEPLPRWAADPIDSTSELEDPLIDLSEELAGLSDEGDTELFDGDPVGVYTIALEADESAVEAVDLSPAIQEPAAIAHVQLEPAAAETLDVEPLVETVFVEPPEPPRADIEEWVPMYLSPGRMWPALEGMPAESPAPRTEQPDWIELVASLRQDLERRGARPSDGASAETQPRVRKHRAQPKQEKPVQDEWGFFDPEQCGFSTLLAKLEEITEEVRT